MAEVKGKEAKSGADILKWANKKGKFQCKASTFRNWITVDGNLGSRRRTQVPINGDPIPESACLALKFTLLVRPLGHA